MRYPVGGCEWPNMYIFKSWSFVGTVTSFLEALRVLIEILSIICFFCSICRGEFITRKLYIYIYICPHPSQVCSIVVGRFQILQVWQNNLESPTRIGNNERSFPLKKFHDDHISGKLFHVCFIKQVTHRLTRKIRLISTISKPVDLHFI